MTLALELDQVTKVYGSGRQPRVPVLHGVSLAIWRGDAVGIVGPSGSGKSTMLNIMGTLDQPTSGMVKIGGHCVSTMRDDAVAALRARAIGFVFQQFFLLMERTALDNVAEGLLYSGVRRSVRRHKALEALDRVGLTHRATHKPSQLSGGECQRVAIARALINEPEIVLADEPTGNLDQATGAGILDLFAELHADGTTLAVITHDPQVASRFSRVVSIRDGFLFDNAEAQCPAAEQQDAPTEHWTASNGAEVTT